MSASEITGVFLASLLLCQALHALGLFAEWISPWEFGRNPYRRYCKKCGQRQDFCVPGGWEDHATNHAERHYQKDSTDGR